VMTTLTARDLMSETVATVDQEATPSEAAARLRTEGITRLLVRDGEEPVGVLTVSDLVAALVQLPAERSSVADVMSYGLVVCQATTPLTAAARAMSERRARSLVVLDTAGRLAGVLSGRDMLPLVEGHHASMVADLMTVTPLTIAPDDPLRKAADLMLENGVHRLVVTASGEPHAPPLGLISTADIAAEMANPDGVWRSGS